MIKLIDAAFVLGLGYMLFVHYLTDPIFDLLSIASLFYVAARQWQNANALSLCIVGILFKFIVMAIGSGAACMNGYYYWPLTILVSFLFILIVIHRPILFSNIGPLKNRKGWAETNADDGIVLILILMTAFYSLVLLEHIIRQTIYPVQFLYDMYEYVQASFTVASIAIVLFMINTDYGNKASKLRTQTNDT